MSEQITLAQALVNLRKDLEIAQKEGAGQDIKFKVEEVEVEFQISASSKVGGGGSGELNAGFWKLALKVDVEKSDQVSHKVKFKLRPETNKGEDVKVSGSIPSEY